MQLIKLVGINRLWSCSDITKWWMSFYTGQLCQLSLHGKFFGMSNTLERKTSPLLQLLCGQSSRGPTPREKINFSSSCQLPVHPERSKVLSMGPHTHTYIGSCMEVCRGEKKFTWKVPRKGTWTILSQREDRWCLNGFTASRLWVMSWSGQDRRDLTTYF